MDITVANETATETVEEVDVAEATETSEAAKSEGSESGQETGNEPVPEPRSGFRFSRDITVLSDPAGPEAESIGALRTHLLAQHIRDGRRSLAICAPSSGIGSSYVAVNLATAFALAGIKTLLIDANMREPSMQNYIEPADEPIGLQQCLNDSSLLLGDAIQDDVLPHLSLIYAGGVAENPQELLANNSFKSIIEDCLRDFEVTIVDTPPSNESADARRIAAIMRYAMLIVRRNDSFVSDLKILSEELQSDRVKVIGTFLNS